MTKLYTDSYLLLSLLIRALRRIIGNIQTKKSPTTIKGRACSVSNRQLYNRQLYNRQLYNRQLYLNTSLNLFTSSSLGRCRLFAEKRFHLASRNSSRSLLSPDSVEPLE